MSVNQRSALRLSFVTGETALPIPSVSEILARVQSGPVWDVASIAPEAGQFPLLHVEWHEGKGFVIQCYEDEHSWSDFLLVDPRCGPLAVEINLSGQALERWPSELFVPEELAGQAVDHFLKSGKQNAALHWVRIDAFPRETIWEDREGSERPLVNAKRYAHLRSAGGDIRSNLSSGGSSESLLIDPACLSNTNLVLFRL